MDKKEGTSQEVEAHFPECRKCGCRLSPSNMSKKIGLCMSCFNQLIGKNNKQCIICRNPVKPGERALRQQVGLISPDGDFVTYETVWYQHAKCRTRVNKPSTSLAKLKKGKSGESHG